MLVQQCVTGNCISFGTWRKPQPLRIRVFWTCNTTHSICHLILLLVYGIAISFIMCECKFGEEWLVNVDILNLFMKVATNRGSKAQYCCWWVMFLKMSDVIVLPPSGVLLLCQCVNQGAKKETKKNCVQVFYLRKNNKDKMLQSSFLLMSWLQEHRQVKQGLKNSSW